MAKLHEIEKKYHLVEDDAASIEKKIVILGAHHVSDSKQTDTYFNVSGRDSYGTKECLRIRETNNNIEITYKPPTKIDQADGGYFSKKEVNLAVKDLGDAKELLMDIGCEMLCVVEKTRKDYLLDKIHISVDTISDMGVFVEVESNGTEDQLTQVLEQIDGIAAKLGLNDSLIERRPYRDIVMEASKQKR
jgi:adenylate cyclase class 2